jgi:hypothetical protein
MPIFKSWFGFIVETKPSQTAYYNGSIRATQILDFFYLTAEKREREIRKMKMLN